YIARISDGSMRDALSILDQCATFYFNQPITLENVLDVVGAVDDRVFFELTDALHALNGGRVMEIIDEVSNRGRDIGRFVADFMAHLRNLLVARSVKEPCAALNLNADAVARLAGQAGDIASGELMRYINIFSELQGQLRYSANGRILFEVCCLRLCAPAESAAGDADADTITDARLRKLEDGLKQMCQGDGSPDTAAESAVKTEKRQAPSPAPPPDIPAQIKKSMPDDIAKACESWAGFVRTVKQVPLNVYLGKTTPCYLEGNALMLVSESAAMPEVLRKFEPEIKAALTKQYNREFELVFVSRAEYDERHRRLYGAPDSSDVFSAESLTEKLNMDIIIED
ncbi:MAG: hypothetical protein FWE68_03005, partial [Defluviitaleaceae bacterium]|nr:hypothetical protein [Defluviitaleaceae bacterium]